jgi:tetratricopeptide (TPR) repeat protein
MTLEEALQLHKSDHLDAAEQGYRQHLEVAPDDGDALHLLGVLRHQRGDSTEAAELIQRAIAQAPERAQYHLSLGGVQMHLGDTQTARVSFETALALDPNSVEAHSTLGHLALIGGDVAGAESRFKVGRRADEDDPMLLFGLGSVYLDRNDPANAAKFLARAAERKPGDAAIQVALGRALFEQGAFAFAEKAFENALRLSPEMAPAKLYLARSRLRLGKLDDARALFAELADGNVQAFGGNAGLGDVARKKGQIVKALKFYRRALDLDPAHAGAYNACAWCMEQLGDLAGAAEYLSTGLQRVPETDELRVPLAGLLDRLGRKEEAAQVRQVIAERAQS